MKRLLITTLIIGVAVAFGVGALHASKTMAGFEGGRYSACLRLFRRDANRQ